MNGEGGPAKGRPPAPAAKQSLGNYDTHDLVGVIGAQLRRRRDAALRLEPMSCGHRDELDCLAAEPMAAEISYCCASLGLEQSAALARMGRHCSPMSCARLPAAS